VSVFKLLKKERLKIRHLVFIFRREKRDVPFLISACIREVARRGMCEVGSYRVSGSASDLAKLKKSFESSEFLPDFSAKTTWISLKFLISDSYEAEQLLKEVDIHSVTGILKSYLRELPGKSTNIRS